VKAVNDQVHIGIGNCRQVDDGGDKIVLYVLKLVVEDNKSGCVAGCKFAFPLLAQLLDLRLGVDSVDCGKE